MPPASLFRFQKYDTIGSLDAESDDRYLSKCFVNTGAIDILCNCGDERAIALGRTGAGKTALLKILGDNQEKIVALDPHNIALSYLSASTVLQFLEGLQVDLSPFYRFLWRHVLVVEILKLRFQLRTEEQQASMVDELYYTILRKQAHKEAFEYLRTWGTKFVESTEQLIHDSTKKLESDYRSSVGVNASEFMKLGIEGGERLTAEERTEFRQRAQEVISRIQVNKLTVVLNALDEEILTDNRRRYYITIDRLDEDWVDDPRRYRLLKALLDSVRDFNSKVRYAKIILALRTDLFDRVLKATTGAGFQDEKYRSLCLPITWGQRQLGDVLDARINELVKSRYTTQAVTHEDLLPKLIPVDKVKERPLNFIVDRTLLRPRDVIAFFNKCIENAEDTPEISSDALLAAEAQYSQERLTSLKDEWSVQYPYLVQMCRLLKRRPALFRLGDIDDDALDELCVLLFTDTDSLGAGEDAEKLESYYNGRLAGSDLRVFIAKVLYRVGIVGLKTESYSQVVWSYKSSGSAEMPASEISDETRLQVHKIVWRALGIRGMDSPPPRLS